MERHTISKEEKVLIYRVFKYFEQMANDEVSLIFQNESKSSLISRICEISDFGHSTIQRIVDKGLSFDDSHNSNNSSLDRPSQISEDSLSIAFERKPKILNFPSKAQLSDLELNEIRRMIYTFHQTEGRLVTVKALSNKIKTELGIDLSRPSVTKIMKELGFKFVKSENNRVKLIEREDIVTLRKVFLQKIALYRAESRPIVYLDETYVHTYYTSSKAWTDQSSEGFKAKIGKGQRFIVVSAGGSMGFIPNALLVFRSNSQKEDYHGDMNGENFEKWATRKLIPNLPQNSVVVIDNAPYHNVLIDPPPNTNSRKALIQEWLVRKVIISLTNQISIFYYFNNFFTIFAFNRMLL